MRPLGISLIVGGMIMMIITAVNFFTGGVVNPGMVEILNVEFDPRTWTPMIGTFLMLAGVVVLVTGAADEKTPV